MSTAGPLTRSVSKRIRPAETFAANDYHATTVQTPSRARTPQPQAGCGQRLHPDEVVIGLALGSPSQSPIMQSPDNRHVDFSCVCNAPDNRASTFGYMSEIDSGVGGIKRKGSKWKTLGSFFGRRQSPFASHVYQVDHEQQPELAKQLITQDHSKTKVFRRRRAITRHGGKAHQVDSLTGLTGEESNSLLRRTSLRRRGLRRRKVEEPQPEMQQIPTKYTGHAAPENLDLHRENQTPTPGSSLLQIEIPCTELERYSVMFGDVLKPPGRQSKPQPSLLARRQAHLEDLKTVADSSCEVFYSVMAINGTTSSRLCDSVLILFSQTPLCELIRCHSRLPSLSLSHSSLRLHPNQAAAL